MNQLKSIYNSPFKDSLSHPIHTYFPQVWNDNLAILAQQWASCCWFAHGQPEDYKSLGFHSLPGQNLFFHSNYFKHLNVTWAIKNWYDEKDDYVFETKKCNGKQCGHYTQVEASHCNFAKHLKNKHE